LQEIVQVCFPVRNIYFLVSITWGQVLIFELLYGDIEQGIFGNLSIFFAISFSIDSPGRPFFKRELSSFNLFRIEEAKSENLAPSLQLSQEFQESRPDPLTFCLKFIIN